MTKIKQLWEAIIDLPDLSKWKEELIEQGSNEREIIGYIVPFIELSHLLRVAEERWKDIFIETDGSVYQRVRYHGIENINRICDIDLSLPLSDQTPETLEKLAEVVCG